MDLLDVGPCGVGFNGAEPLTWSELLAWTTSTGVQLTHWEQSTLVILSTDYAQTAKNYVKGTPAPWQAENLEVEKALARRVTSAMDAAMEATNGRLRNTKDRR